MVCELCESGVRGVYEYCTSGCECYMISVRVVCGLCASGVRVMCE